MSSVSSSSEKYILVECEHCAWRWGSRTVNNGKGVKHKKSWKSNFGKVSSFCGLKGKTVSFSKKHKSCGSSDNGHTCCVLVKDLEHKQNCDEITPVNTRFIDVNKYKNLDLNQFEQMENEGLGDCLFASFRDVGLFGSATMARHEIVQHISSKFADAYVQGVATDSPNQFGDIIDVAKTLEGNEDNLKYGIEEISDYVEVMSRAGV